MEVRPFLPAALLALFGAWSGTLVPGAGAFAPLAGHLALAAAILWAGAGGPDPLGLGRGGRWLPWLFLGVLALSVWLSPVPRAGRFPLLLAPALFLLPAAVARCWSSSVDREKGLTGVALVAAGSAAWALGDLLRSGVEKAAAPLGHHLLLATWLAALLPLAAAAGRRPGWPRWLGWGGAGLCAVALMATRSISGVAGLAVASWAIAPSRRARGLLLAGAALAAVAGRERLLAVATAADPSLRARLVYWRAGLEGLLERPLLGWGPGSTPWTVSRHLRPEPGVNPPGEVVGDLHSLPVHLAYELGALGLGLGAVAAALFVTAGRRRAAAEDGDWQLARAACAALAASAASLAAGVVLGTLGPWVVLGVAAGALLAASPQALPAHPGGPSRWAWPALAVAGLLATLPMEAARVYYDRARAQAFDGELGEARRLVRRAVALDPSFPLYQARQGDLMEDPSARVAAALEAARSAGEVPMLWLAAGARGLEAGEPWSAEALSRACRLDPLGLFPPLLLLTARPESPAAPRWGGQALLAEPSLAAATWWQGQPGALDRALEAVEVWPGVDAGWREAATGRLAGLPTGGPTSRLVLDVDTEPAAYTFSLFAFRRLPWPAEIASVVAWRRGLDAVDLPPASALRSTRAEAFSACRELLNDEEPKS
jgi:hypothetical protein